MTGVSMLRLLAADLQEFAQSAFIAAGLDRAHAQTVAGSLVGSDLRGTNSHGVIRLPFLIERLLKGGANRRPEIRTIQEAPATALVDGDRALGAITASHAMELAVAKARSQGIGFVAATNSDFIGACAHYALMALPHDMIGMAWTNGYPGMTPWGGRRNTIGNNPMAFAAPSLSRGPIVLDMALSVVAGGRVRLAAKKKESIPTDWVIDRDGQATNDPADLAAGGALLPLGYKGYGLAIFGEILCGILTGSRILSEIPAWFIETNRSIANGHMHIAIDISRFIEPETFKRRVDEMSDMIKLTPNMPGRDILLPGERAWQACQEQQRNGIGLPVSVVDDLASLAHQLGIKAPATFG